MPPQAESSPGAFPWRLGLTLVLAVYGWICLRSPGTYRWLDSLDLAIHETGHLVFAPGGETLGVMGGTLMQLIVPSVFAGALWRQGDLHGATVPLWWLGQKWLEYLGVYPGRSAAGLAAGGRWRARLGVVAGELGTAGARPAHWRHGLSGRRAALPDRSLGRLDPGKEAYSYSSEP